MSRLASQVIRLELLAEFELLGYRLVAVQVDRLEIVQQSAPLANHHQQSAARTVIFLVGLQMLGQMVDPLRKQRDLHVGGTSVLRVRLKLFNRFCLRFHNKRSG